jgi:hypothetical protein
MTTLNIEDAIKVYEPHNMPDRIAERVERFRIPRSDFSSECAWQKEVAIDRSYNNRVITIVASLEREIIATARIILKLKTSELLPIEHSKVVSVFGNMSVPGLKIGKHFRPDLVLPQCEIGGFRAIDQNKGVSVRDRHFSLYSVAKRCETEVYKRGGIMTVFLSCPPVSNMVKLYNRFQFTELCEVTYTGKDLWKTLWRWPYKGGLKK